MQLRKYRERHFNKAFDYEVKVEIIEGMAEFIELKALKLLNNNQYIKTVKYIKNQLSQYKSLITIRPLSYHVGALLLLICDKNNISYKHEIGKTEQTIYDLISRDISYEDIPYEIKYHIEELIQNYELNNKNKIDDFIKHSKNKVLGSFSLIGLDPMNTIKIEDYIHCKHFIAYLDKKEQVFLKKECVAKIHDLVIEEIYY